LVLSNLSAVTQNRPLGFLFSKTIQLSLHYYLEDKRKLDRSFPEC